MSAAISLLVVATPASAQVFSGNTAGGPTYNRATEGEPPTVLSGLGNAVRYQSFGLTAPVTGAYTFQVTAAYDNFLTLYQTAFDPANALTNALVANGDNPDIGTSGFTRNLTSGTQYFLVSSGFRNTDFGAFDGVATGPANLVFQVAAVPEPAAWALLIGGFGAAGGMLRRRHRTVAALA